jgi:hypothetical protein
MATKKNSSRTGGSTAIKKTVPPPKKTPSISLKKPIPAPSARPKQGRAAVITKKTPVNPAAPAPASRASTPPDILMAQAEAAITNAIESMNCQMNQAMQALTSLAAGAEQGRPVVRTAPLDRTTAMFHRLVSELLDDQLAEILPPLISLRGELTCAANEPTPGTDDAGTCRRGVEILDHVLKLAGVAAYEPRIGETFDPLIHMGVGESHRQDLADGAVADSLQPGFRSARGKVLTPAKVMVNRR